MSVEHNALQTSSSSKVAEVDYYYDILADLVRSHSQLVRKGSGVAITVAQSQRRSRLEIRLPRALEQLHCEINKLATDTLQDIKTQAWWRCRLLLFEAAVSSGLAGGVTFDVDELIKNYFVTVVQHKLQLVLEEALAFQRAVQESESGSRGGTVMSIGPLLPAMRGNLKLRIFELHDVLSSSATSAPDTKPPSTSGCQLDHFPDEVVRQIDAYKCFVRHSVGKIAVECNVDISDRILDRRDEDCRPTPGISQLSLTPSESCVVSVEPLTPAVHQPPSGCCLM